MKELVKKEEKKHIKILGITAWRIFAYFIIYSIIGFFVETLFGVIKYRNVRK